MKARFLLVALTALLLCGCDMFGKSAENGKTDVPESNATQTQAVRNDVKKAVSEKLPAVAVKKPIALKLPDKPQNPARAKATPNADRDKASPTKHVPPPKIDPSSCVSIAYGPQGKPGLKISFPWKQFERPSLQAKLVTDSDVDVLSLKPVELDGPAVSRLWKKQVDSINKPIHPTSSELLRDSTNFIEYGNGKLLALRARQNMHGRPAGYAIDRSGTLLVFYELDDWANEDGNFYFNPNDLNARSKFAQPGRIRVTLLSDEKPIWSTTVEWDGKEKKPAPMPKTPTNTQPKKLPETTATKLKQPLSIDLNPSKPKPTTPVLPEPIKKTVPSEPKAKPKPETTSSDRPKGDVRDMSIDELAKYIESRWKGQMSTKVRKAWLGGWYNYFKVGNPEPVRRDVFMSLLRTCYKLQPPGELRNAFAVLYSKLRLKGRSE